MEDEQPDVRAEAHAAVKAAQLALEQADRALGDVRRWNGIERRQRTRLLEPAKPAPPEIVDLAALPPDEPVTVKALAEYWQCHQNSVLYWIRTRRLAARRRGRRAWDIRAGDALAFEPRIFSHTQKRITR